MTTPIPPSLDRFGDDLHRAACRELSPAPEPVRATGRRTRVLAGSSLGLAGVAAAVLFAVSGTTATSPAYAITQKDGTVSVKMNFWGHKTLLAADQKLIARYHETALVRLAPGPATVSGAVTCTPTADTAVSGDPMPAGPPVKILLGTDGTAVVPAGDTGAGTVHLSSCATYVSYPDSNSGSGNTGNG